MAVDSGAYERRVAGYAVKETRAAKVGLTVRVYYRS